MHTENQNEQSPEFKLHHPILMSIMKPSLYPRFNYYDSDVK